MRDPAPWQKRYPRMLLLACLFGLLSQYLFVDKAAGISVILFMLGFYCIFFYAVRGRLGGFDKWRGQTAMGWFLFLPIGLLAITYMLFANELFRTLNSFALLILAAAQTMLLTRSSVHTWHGIRFFQDVLHHLIAGPLTKLSAPFSVAGSIAINFSSEKTASTWGYIRKISMGLLLAAPLLLVVIMLLSSADPIFQSWLEKIPTSLEGLSLGSVIYRTGVAILIALYTFCFLWALLFPKEVDAKDTFMEGGTSSPSEKERRFLDPIVASTFLVSVNLVYILFTVIQFSYLFGSTNGLLPANIAYAEYARRGFAELIIAALINLALLLMGLHFVRRAGHSLEMIRKLLLSILVSCTFIMLISAYSRLSLYEEAYGFTQSRLLVHGFMWFLGVLLIIAFVRIWRERFSLSKAYLCTSIVAYVLMNYMNMDHRIASNNIERFNRTGVIDMSYLGKLSTDAAPSLLKLQAKQPEIPGLKEAVEKLQRKAQRDTAWPSWNVSKWRVH
ncbi:DUF4153 domain-containing protein [Paenibacillus eucommiae]|uniref:DUF4173 domain-containing protein n=1 Tax=Paenibacillus eucommiae TaxID=1355755 RepID=A0ABS4IS60_9BACL|nr:DUF4173 domain-containing protein [Paenibacillus eucommiae]MBP1990412.1 hypothetical protein [Paenibacillus eucommiae]